MAVSQLKGGAILSYATIFLNVTIGLLITPLIINSLGDAEYGLYTMIGALIGQLTVLDFGLNNTIIRYVAKYRADKDRHGEENFLAHIFSLYFGIAFIILFIGLIAYFNLDYFYGDQLTEAQLYKARTMVIILLFNLAVTLPGGAFLGICSGYEEFILPKIAGIAKYLIRSLLVVVLLYNGGDSVGLVVLDTVVNLIIVVVHMVIVFRKLGVHINLHQWDRKLLKSMFGFSIWIFVFALVSQLRWPFGQAVLGTLFEPALIAVYAVGITLGNYYGAFSSGISSVFLPRAVQMVSGTATNRELTTTFIQISRLTLFILLYVFGGFIILGKEFITMWVGDNYLNAYYYVLLIMFGLTFTLSQTFANDIMQARNMLSFRGYTLLGVTFLGLAAGAVLSMSMGMIGMLIGIVSFMFVERVIMWWYFNRHLHLLMRYYFYKTLPLFFTIILTIPIILVLKVYFKFTGLYAFAVYGTIYSILYFIISRYLLTRYEKDLLISLIPKRIRI